MSPHGIIVGAEKLHPFQRQLIEKVFQAPVFETYGSREVMLMSAECDRHEGLHLTSENLLLEILDDNGQPTPPGQEGNIVVTDLFNYGMPFIRYINGDRGLAGWKQCSCGRGLPLMQPPQGRELDMRMPDGGRIAGPFFQHLLKDFDAVRRFQVIQDTADHVEVRLVIAGEWNEQLRGRLESAIRSIVGSEIKLDLRPVEAIALTGVGKLKVVVNLCATPNSNQGAVAYVNAIP